jgi:hypothetical protein
MFDSLYGELLKVREGVLNRSGHISVTQDASIAFSYLLGVSCELDMNVVSNGLGYQLGWPGGASEEI